MSLSLPLKVILWLLAFQSLFIERGASKIICSYCVRLSLCSPRPQLQQCSNYLHFTLFPANKIHSKRELNIFLTEMNLVQESKVQFHDLMYLLFIWLHRMLFSFFFFFFFCFLGPTCSIWGIGVPRLGGQLGLHRWGQPTATAMHDPSRVCNLHHSSCQCQILNLLRKARDRTHHFMVTSQIHFCCTTTGSS